MCQATALGPARLDRGTLNAHPLRQVAFGLVGRDAPTLYDCTSHTLSSFLTTKSLKFWSKIGIANIALPDRIFRSSSYFLLQSQSLLKEMIGSFFLKRCLNPEALSLFFFIVISGESKWLVMNKPLDVYLQSQSTNHWLPLLDQDTWLLQRDENDEKSDL